MIVLLVLSAGAVMAQVAAPTPTVTIPADRVGARVSPVFYGLMTEEINYAYEGGLYAELVNNRAFRPETNNMRHWKLLQPDGSVNAMSVVTDQPLNAALTNSLKLDVTAATEKQPVGIANDGYWGIPVRPQTKYEASFYAKAPGGFDGPITVSLVSDGSEATVFASGKVSRLSADWQKYTVTLTTGNVPPSKDNHLLVSVAKPGVIYFNLVSLFPPTYKNRPNGNRPDIMQLLAEMHPSFLRLPGGNYLEGNTIATRFNWKETIHDVSTRPGHLDDAWGYWSNDGLGLLEYLEWCEDLQMEPVLAVYAGYSMRPPVRVAAGPGLQPYVQDALDEIEYVTGDPSTKWGAQRAADGHPAPFKLEYVEVGNEDNFDRTPGSYDGRFTQFYDAIKTNYPKLQVIATTRVTSRTPDVLDNHLYVGAGEYTMQGHFHDYDRTARTGTKIFEGEWATRAGWPTPKMADALGDAVFLMGMERNSDAVVMESYAPLLVNVSDAAKKGRTASKQWDTDLIGYDALTSYGSPAYYVQAMFSNNHGDAILPATIENAPTREVVQPAGARRGGAGDAGTAVTNKLATIFTDATLDTKSKMIYVKIVNSADHAQDVHFEISGLPVLKPSGEAVVLSATSPEDTNSIKEPKKVAPVSEKVTGLGKSFTRSFPAYSVTVLKIQGS
jgi:alpha-N-arabinofuranosidase